MLLIEEKIDKSSDYVTSLKLQSQLDAISEFDALQSQPQLNAMDRKYLKYKKKYIELKKYYNL